MTSKKLLAKARKVFDAHKGKEPRDQSIIRPLPHKPEIRRRIMRVRYVSSEVR